MMELSTQHAFFSSVETSFKDCPLGRMASGEVKPQLDMADLDKSLAKTPSSLEKYADVTNHEFRELTEQEKADLKEKTGWTDAQIAKCTINDEGVIQYKTDRSDLEGTSGENGVRYERKRVEINGVTVEGVFPVFDSAFDAQLPEDLQKASNPAQFRECNRQLKAAIEADPELKKKFTEEQLEEIYEGGCSAPTGYTWHHNEEVGKMQLVKTEDHDRTQGGAAHTGGKSLWGDKYGDDGSCQASDNGGAS